MSRIDHGPGTEEQERLEEGVGHQMEDGPLPGTDPKGQKHVAYLAHGGIGEDPLDVSLHQGGETGQH
jgi:hypothetical protein